MQGEHAIALNGRIDLLEERMEHIDQKIDRVSEAQSGLAAKQDHIIDQLQEMKVDRAERNALFQRFIDRMEAMEEKGRERFEWGQRKLKEVNDEIDEIHANCHTVHVTESQTPEDSFEAFKKRVFNVLQIAVGIVAILALLVFAEHNLLSPQAAKTAHEAIETVK